MGARELEPALAILKGIADAEGLFRAIDQYPSLLTPAVLEALEQSIDGERAPATRDHLRMLHAILVGCSEQGIDQVRRNLSHFQSQQQEEGPSALLFGLHEMLNRLSKHDGIVAASLYAAMGWACEASGPTWWADAIQYLELARRKLTARRDPYARRLLCGSLGNLYLARGDGGRAEDVERAIACYREALSACRRDIDALGWGHLQFALGNALCERRGDARAKSIEEAISAYRTALAVCTRARDPQAWARIHANLATAYRERRQGDPSENAERALRSYGAAGEVLTLANDPQAWAELRNSLGSAYGERPSGRRIDNIERAIACFEDVLKIRTRGADPVGWARAKNNLAIAYRCRLRGSHAENLEMAIEAYLEAATILTRSDFPKEWATIRSNLGAAYWHRPSGLRQNMELAARCFRDALSIFTRGQHPDEWAEQSFNLGLTLFKRQEGERRQNIEDAITCYGDALQVATEAYNPHAWAQIQVELASAYQQRQCGITAENIEHAIVCYDRAFCVLTKTSHPNVWARARNDLGRAYANRLQGDRAANLECAIACFDEAKAVLVRRNDPRGWAATRALLANGYRERLRGDRAENIEQAIGFGKEALTVFTRASDPRAWASIQDDLGWAYRERQRGTRAENLAKAIGCFEAALAAHSRADNPRAWARARGALGVALCERRRVEGGQPDVEEAIRCHEDAASILEPANDALGWATSRYNLAMAYAQRTGGNRSENLERAVTACRDATASNELILRPSRQAEMLGQEALLLMQLGQQHWEKAARRLDRAMGLVATHRGEAHSAEARREILSALSGAGRWSAIIEAGRGRYGAAIEKLEASRCISLREALALDELSGSLDDISAAPIRTAAQRIDNLRREAAQPFAIGQSRPYPAIVADLRDAQASLDRAKTAVGCQAAETLSVPELLAAIPPGATLIIPIATEFGGRVFVVPSGTISLDQQHVVDLPGLTFDALRQRTTAWLVAYRRARTNRGKPSFGRLWQVAALVLDAVLYWLWKEVMAPALAKLSMPHSATEESDPPELLIVPVGDFAALPLHAAWFEVEGRRRAVLDDFVVSYTPSLFATRAARQRQSTKNRRAGLLALINPAGDLPASERLEVPMLRQLTAGRMPATILTGDLASKSALKAESATCAYLHLSCHGEFDWRNLDRSGLDLAANQRLSMTEIVADLSLEGCRWVVLSACETGIADIETAPGEAIGQVAAFLEAGAAAVTASLWATPDTSAAQYAEKAYEEHLVNRRSPAQASRRAALWVRDHVRSSASPEEESSALRFAHLSGRSRPRLEEETASVGPSASVLSWAVFCTWGV